MKKVTGLLCIACLWGNGRMLAQRVYFENTSEGVYVTRFDPQGEKALTASLKIKVPKPDGVMQNVDAVLTETRNLPDNVSLSSGTGVKNGFNIIANDATLTLSYPEGLTEPAFVSSTIRIIRPLMNLDNNVSMQWNGFYDIDGDGVKESCCFRNNINGGDYIFWYQWNDTFDYFTEKQSFPLEAYNIYPRLFCLYNDTRYPCLGIGYGDRGSVGDLYSMNEEGMTKLSFPYSSPYPNELDINNDGLHDLIATDSKRRFMAYLQHPSGEFVPVRLDTMSLTEMDSTVYQRWESIGVNSGFSTMTYDQLSAAYALSQMFGRSLSQDYLPGNGFLIDLDVNKDNLPDLIDTKQNVIYYNRGNNRFSVEPFKGRVTAKDLNGDMITDYLFYEEKTKTVSSMVYEGEGKFAEQVLIQNLSISNMYCYDFDKDGDVDVLLTFDYSNSSGWSFLVFCENDGKGKFTIHENSFEEQYKFWDCADVNNDGFMDLVVSEMTDEYTGYGWEKYFNHLTLLFGMEQFGIRKSDFRIQHTYDRNGTRFGNFASAQCLDYNGDGKMDILFTYDNIEYKACMGIQLCDLMDVAPNARPEQMEAPRVVFNQQSKQLKVSWLPGKDKESSTADLTYALRIGTQPGMGDVYYACSNEDGVRLRDGEGNMGAVLDKVLNVDGWQDGIYYVAVQAVDPMGQASVWSPETVYHHQCMSSSFIVSGNEISGGDTLVVALPGLVDAAYRYEWDFSDGKVIDQNIDGSIYKIVFPTQGKKTLRLVVSDAVGHKESRSVTVSVLGGNYVSYGPCYPYGWVDFDGDGHLELIEWEGVYQMQSDFSYKKVGKIYNSDLQFEGEGIFRDLNMDGKVDYLASSIPGRISCKKGDWICNTGGLNLTFSGVPESNLPVSESQFSNVYYGPDFNNDGIGDAYHRSNNIGDGIYSFYFSEGNYQKFSKFDLPDSSDDGYCYFDGFVDYNRDGYLDFVSLLYRNDVYEKSVPTLFQNTGKNSFKKIPLFGLDDFQITLLHLKGAADFNNDGIQDLYYIRNSKTISIYYGDPGYKYSQETFYALPQSYTISKGGILFVRDMDNNGYLDIVMDTAPAGTGILYFSSAGAEFRSYPDMSKVEDSPFVDLNGDSSPDLLSEKVLCSHLTNVKNSSPQAPLNLRAYQTETGMMLKWDDAVDAETPAIQMRYNVSVKKKGATGENAFVLSPLNDLKDEAAIVPSHIYQSATQMQVPISCFESGREYELQVQSIDLWNAHSPMSEVYTFTVESRVAISAQAEACLGGAIEVSYIGTESGVCTWNWDGGKVVSESDGRFYRISWDTPGVKNVSVTVAGLTSAKAIKVNEPVDLDFEFPSTTLAGCEVEFVLPKVFKEKAKSVVVRKSDEKIRIVHREGTQEAKVIFPSAGEYWIEVSLSDSLCGEISNRKKIEVVGEIPVPVIRLVGIDAESGYNKIMWDMPGMPEYVTTVDVYKEGSSYNRFEKIAQVEPSAGFYIDRLSSSRVAACRYQIRLNTIYDVESAPSKIHSSTHLMLNKGMGGSVNLVWNRYEGGVVESYRILCGTAADNLSLLAEISGANTSYTDVEAGDAVRYYALEYDNTYSDDWKPLSVMSIDAFQSGRSNVVSTGEAYEIVLAKSLSVLALEKTLELTPEQPSLHLYTEIFPVNVDLKGVNWQIVEGGELASVNQNGLLTVNKGSGNGRVIVGASTVDGSNLFEELRIMKSGFVVLPASITIACREVSTELTPTQKLLHLSAKVLPEEATDTRVVWSLIQGEALATISNDGTLEALGDDNGMIKVRAASVGMPNIYGEIDIEKNGFRGVGIGQHTSGNIVVYMQQDGLHIENLPSEVNVSLYSVNGQLLEKRKLVNEVKVVWPLDQYPSGIYLLQIKGQTTVWRGHFLKK